MTRFKFIGVSVVAIFALLALGATTAFAEEKTKMLPETGVTFKAKGGAGKLVQNENSNAVECKKNKGSGTIESANLGKYETDFEECTLLGGKCTGVGEATGVILNKGTYHFWLALETLNGVANTLVGALVALPEEIHFTCVVLGFNQLVVVRGCVAALATPLNKLASVTKDIAAQSNGIQLITKVLPAEATKEIECKLESSVNGGAFKQSALEGTEENETFKSGGSAITVLLMNPEAKE